jgi:CheY-like chemotaxis protein
MGNGFIPQLLEHRLTRQGHQVRLANNGREALALVEEGAFDVLLLDVPMPELARIIHQGGFALDLV